MALNAILAYLLAGTPVLASAQIIRGGRRGVQETGRESDKSGAKEIIEDCFQLTHAWQGMTGDGCVGTPGNGPAELALDARLNEDSVALAAECLGRRRC
jgi:hypothetical protein